MLSLIHISLANKRTSLIVPVKGGVEIRSLCIKLCSACISVSYTHLDVYKRQASIPTAQQTSGIEKLDLSQLSGLTNELICWGPGVERDGNGQIVGAVKAQERYGKYDALFIGGNQKKIILTFDEGYENGYTAGILDTLKAKKVSAVFFITGDYLERESALIQRMIDEGHIIGNHSVCLLYTSRCV